MVRNERNQAREEIARLKEELTRKDHKLKALRTKA